MKDPLSNPPTEHDLEHLLDDLCMIVEHVSHSERDVDVTLLSFVIPIKDESETISTLCRRIAQNIPAGYTHEIILIDDGSQDDSWQVIEEMVRDDPDHIRGIQFRHNSGKALALAAGFRAAVGDLVFTMDGDLQDDPAEIPRFIAKLEEGFDLVSGWKKVRHDPWHKVLPSRVFNVLVSAASGVWLHDHNCGFKCYRAAVVKRLKLHGELHRMLPSMAGMHGFRCTEIEVQHHPRRRGRSKYGLERFLRGFSDAITIGFLLRFRERPAHFFNPAAGLQVAIAATLTGLAGPANGRLLGGVFMASAVVTFLCGLLAELMIRGPLDVPEQLPVQRDTAHYPTPTEEGSVKDTLPAQRLLFDIDAVSTRVPA